MCAYFGKHLMHRNFKVALDSRSPIKVGDKLRGNDRVATQDCHSRLDRESRKVAALPPNLHRVGIRAISARCCWVVIISTGFAGAIFAQDKIVLENDSLRAEFHAKHNYVPQSVCHKPAGGEKGVALIRSFTPVFGYATADEGVFRNGMNGDAQFADAHKYRGFKLIGKSVAKDAFSVEVEDFALRIRQQCSLTNLAPGPSCLEVEYTYTALQDVLLGPFSFIPDIVFNSSQYERIIPSYRVHNGGLEQIVKKQIEQPLIDATPTYLQMKDWFGVRDPESKDGLLLFFPAFTGRSHLKGSVAYLNLTGPFIEDKFIPRGEVFTHKIYIVPFHGDYEPVLRLYGAKFGIDLARPLRPARSPSGTKLAQNESFAVWGDIPTWQVLQDEKAPSVSAESIEICAARDEYEPFQLVIRGNDDMPYTRMEGLRLDFTDLKHASGKSVIAKDNMEYKLVDYIDLIQPWQWWGWTGLSPDALREAKSFACDPEKNTVLWVTVKVPKETPAGNYTGSIRIIQGLYPARKGGIEATIVPLKLRVFDFVMPEERHLGVWIPTFYRYKLDLMAGGKMDAALYKRYIDDIVSHRASLSDARLVLHFNKDSAEIKNSNLFHPVEREGVDLDSFEEQLRESIDVVKMPVVVCTAFTIGKTHKLTDTPFGKAAETLAPLWKKRFVKTAEMLRDFLRERKWERKVAFYLYDEPTTEDIPTVIECAKLLRAVFPEIRLTCATMWLEPRFNGIIKEHYVGGGYAHFPCQKLKDAGDILWRRNILCGSIDTPVVAMRLFLWMLWRDRFDAWNVWSAGTLADWNPPKQTASSDLNRAFSWVYPGENGPVDTIRWEILREGLEDFEYLWTLKDMAGQAKKMNKLSADDGAVVSEAEQLLQDAVNALVPRKGRFESCNWDPMLLHEYRKKIGLRIEKMAAILSGR